MKFKLTLLLLVSFIAFNVPAAEVKILLLGEVHDNAVQHQLRAKRLQNLLESGARPALLMEQFDRELQPALDAAHLADASAAELIAIGKNSAGGKGWDWPLYQAFIELATRYKLPIVAANVSATDSRAIYAKGLAAMGFIGEVPPDIQKAQTRLILDSHCGMLNEAQASKMTAMQVARDQFMAQMVEKYAARGAVLLAGNGHVRTDIGVSRWLAPAVRISSVAVGYLEVGDPNLTFDEINYTPAQTRQDPCLGMTRPK